MHGGVTAFPVSISNNFTLTLTGEDGLGTGDTDTYDGLGNITLNGANAGLTINSGTSNLIMLDGTIDGGAAGQGVLRVSTDTTFAAAVGATKSLASITVDAGVTIYNAIAATNIVVNGGKVDTIDAVNGAIDFANAGKLSAGGLVTGAAVLTTDGTLTLGAGISNAVTSVGNNGTLIVNAGDVGGAIGTHGGANILKQVTFNGASNVTSIDATNVTINNGAADVKAANAITAAVNFAADGALTANNGITGAVTAAGGNGTLTTAGVGVTGAVGTNGASLKALNAKVDGKFYN